MQVLKTAADKIGVHDFETASAQIEANKHTAITTAYYLSLKRFIR
jgi:hypothetical protein